MSSEGAASEPGLFTLLWVVFTGALVRVAQAVSGPASSKVPIHLPAWLECAVAQDTRFSRLYGIVLEQKCRRLKCIDLNSVDAFLQT